MATQTHGSFAFQLGRSQLRLAKLRKRSRINPLIIQSAFANGDYFRRKVRLSEAH